METGTVIEVLEAGGTCTKTGDTGPTSDDIDCLRKEQWLNDKVLQIKSHQYNIS